MTEQEFDLNEETLPAADEDVISDNLDRLDRIEARLSVLEEGINGLQEELQNLLNWMDVIPRSLRQLSTKIEGMTTSINESRIKSLLNELIVQYDLLEQALRVADPGSTEAQNYKTLITQIQQAFQANGLYQIPQQAHFDALIHKAVQTQPCQTSEEAGEIIEYYRQGFRTDQAVLRYAEVVVKRYIEE